MRVFGWQTLMRNESELWELGNKDSNAPQTDLPHAGSSKHGCWDPKGGELCLDRMKPEETLVEVRSRSDVQIDGQIWV